MRNIDLKTSTFALAFTWLLFVPLAASADVVSDIHIQSGGEFSAKNLVVMQVAGTTVFARATWGQAFVRVTVLTNGNTTVMKNHGEGARVADIGIGDRMDVDGMIQSGADSLMVTAKAIRDNSLEKESKTFSGKILTTNSTSLSFSIQSASFGSTTVQLSASTPIKKGARTIEFSELAVGDKVLSAVGTYDYPSNTLAATSVEIYQNKTVFAPKNFQGTLNSLSGTTLPATATITVGSTEYKVYLSAKASVLSKSTKASSLSRFVVGDSVRFYGAIRQTNLGEIDAEIIRDMNF